MAEIIKINGRDLLLKKLVLLVLMFQRCGYINRKESVRFVRGITAIRCVDGRSLIFSTHNCNDQKIQLYFCESSKYSIREVLFSDPELDMLWSQLFVYFFDDDGALLMYADRNNLEEIGFRFDSVNQEGAAKIRKEACNVAAIWGADLLDEIKKIEDLPYDDGDFHVNLLSAEKERE